MMKRFGVILLLGWISCVASQRLQTVTDEEVRDEAFFLPFLGSKSILCSTPSNQFEVDAGGPPCTFEFPCYTTIGGPVTEADCGTCFLLTHEQPEVKSDACANGACPSYSSSIVVKVTEFHRDLETKFGLYQRAWKDLCHFACKGVNACAERADTCAEGSFKDSLIPLPGAPQGFADEAHIPGGTRKAVFPVTWQKIDCLTGDFIEGEHNTGGEGVLGEIPYFAPMPSEHEQVQ